MPRRSWARWLGLTPAALVFVLLGCVATPTFDPAVQQVAVQLKTDTLALVDKSGARYATQQAAVGALLARYAAASDAAATVENNAAVVTAWQTIRGPKAGSAGEFFDMWKQRGIIRPAFRAEKKTQIARHFDYLICLEDVKKGGPACPNPLATTPAGPAPAPAPAGEGEVEQ